MPGAARSLQGEECSPEHVYVMWCRSAVSFSFLFLLTASRMRLCACDTASRLCVRTVLCSLAFPSAPPLPSANSAAASRRFVRRLHRYYGRVRLLRSVHHGLRLPAFPVRPRARLARVVRRSLGSRSERRTRMPGSTDDAEPAGTRDSAPARVAFCRLEGIGTPNGKSFAAQWLAYAFPCQRFTCGLTTARA